MHSCVIALSWKANSFVRDIIIIIITNIRRVNFYDMLGIEESAQLGDRDRF